MQAGWAQFLRSIAGGVGNIPGMGGLADTLGTAAIDAQSGVYGLEGGAADANEFAANWASQANALTNAMTAPLASVQALKDAVASTKQEIAATIPPVNDLGGALEGAGGKGAGAAKAIKDSVKEIADAANTGAEKIGGLFTGLLDGSKSVRASIADLIMEIAKMQLMNGFKSLFGDGGPFGGIGSWLGGLIGKNAAGTEHWRGGLTSVNERGGEIMDLPSGTRIIPHDISKSMVANQTGGGGVSISIDARGAQQGVAEQIASQMQRALPDIIKATRANIGARQSRGYAV